VEWRQARGIEEAATSPGKERLGHRPGRPALILYLDTSSLIKLYVEENGSSEIESLVGQASLVCTSVVALKDRFGEVDARPPLHLVDQSSWPLTRGAPGGRPEAVSRGSDNLQAC
jgi:hypothetical protein